MEPYTTYDRGVNDAAKRNKILAEAIAGDLVNEWIVRIVRRKNDKGFAIYYEDGTGEAPDPPADAPDV